MKQTLCALLVVLGSHVQIAADTGFLDRSVTVDGKTYRYQVYVPADYSPNRMWPVVVNLHGNGAQGPDGLLPTARGFADQIRLKRSSFPVIVLFPQAELGKRWLDADMEQLVMTELERTTSEFHGDPARLYLTGFSMGATGSYRIAYRWPDRFAAIVAVAGRVDTANAQTYSARDKEADRAANRFVSATDPFAALAERIRHLPMRIYHGDADQTVPVEQSRRLVPALKKAGADVEYREYAGADHVPAADKAYAEPDFMTWLLAHHR